MAFNEFLAERMRKALSDANSSFEEKKMMGGLTFMVRGKMCVGIVKDSLMARVGKDAYEDALAKTGARPMDFTGKPMKGYVFVDPIGIDTEAQLAEWISMALDFNKILVP